MSDRPLKTARTASDPAGGTTRQQILTAAATVLRERGLVGMTTRTIARQAGLADGTLYVHFQHKEDLILATIEEQLPRFAPTVPTEPGQLRPLEASLEELVRAALQYSTALVPLAGAVFADPELLARVQATLAERPGGTHLLYRQVADFVESEQQRGRIKARLDPLGVAPVVLGPCVQYALLRGLSGADPLGLNEEEFVTNLVQTLMVCLARRRGHNASDKDRARKAARR